MWYSIWAELIMDYGYHKWRKLKDGHGLSGIQCTWPGDRLINQGKRQEGLQGTRAKRKVKRTEVPEAKVKMRFLQEVKVDQVDKGYDALRTMT
jgi:hypothetical protein